VFVFLSNVLYMKVQVNMQKDECKDDIEEGELSQSSTATSIREWLDALHNERVAEYGENYMEMARFAGWDISEAEYSPASPGWSNEEEPAKSNKRARNAVKNSSRKEQELRAAARMIVRREALASGIGVPGFTPPYPVQRRHRGDGRSLHMGDEACDAIISRFRMQSQEENYDEFGDGDDFNMLVRLEQADRDSKHSPISPSWSQEVSAGKTEEERKQYEQLRRRQAQWVVRATAETAYRQQVIIARAAGMSVWAIAQMAIDPVVPNVPPVLPVSPVLPVVSNAILGELPLPVSVGPPLVVPVPVPAPMSAQAAERRLTAAKEKHAWQAKQQLSTILHYNPVFNLGLDLSTANITIAHAKKSLAALWEVAQSMAVLINYYETYNAQDFAATPVAEMALFWTTEIKADRMDTIHRLRANPLFVNLKAKAAVYVGFLKLYPVLKDITANSGL
jgi:hypothetical protein